MRPLVSFRHTPSRKKQTGDMLIESVVGLLLMGIVGMGVTFTTSRVSVAQHDMALQDVAVSKMRYYVMQNGADHDVCSSTPYITLPNSEHLRASVNGCNAAVAVIGGTTITNAKTPVVLSINSPTLGEVRVGGVIPQ